jgi:hypothetical protein
MSNGKAMSETDELFQRVYELLKVGLLDTLYRVEQLEEGHGISFPTQRLPSLTTTSDQTAVIRGLGDRLSRLEILYGE